MLTPRPVGTCKVVKCVTKAWSEVVVDGFRVENEEKADT